MRTVRFFIVLLLLGSALNAQDFSGIKIYINPGHGGHDPSNDRYIEQTGYWESEGNLTKGLYLRDILVQHNATVFMSRTQNRDKDDLPLSQIDADANANNVDYFQSIHSNGYLGNANYPLVLFRGYDNNPVFPQAKTMGHLIWVELQRLNRQWTYWGSSSENNRGDWDFYSSWGTSGLGVLRYLNMPGTLSEGSFHDYIPNSWRLMSLDYRKHESIVLFRAFVNYFGLNDEPTAVVAGLVRDKSRQVNYSYSYISGLPDDKLKTINRAKVTLVSTGREYITDDNNNGFFMFEHVEPGYYTVIMEGPDNAPDTVDVQAIANRTAFANGFLSYTPNKPPRLFGHFPADKAENQITHTDIILSFSKVMQADSTEQAIRITPEANGSFSWDETNRMVTFSLSDTLRRNTEYEVRVAGSAKGIDGTSIGVDSVFSFTTAADHVHPRLVDYSPGVNGDSALVTDPITLVFDMPMRTTETEAAFRIIPQAEGTFSWNDTRTAFVFTPEDTLQRSTNYTVEITEAAENRYGVHPDSLLGFTFRTRYRNKVELIRSYPQMNQQNVSTRPQFRMVLSSAVDFGTVLRHVKIKDASGNRVPYKSLKEHEQNSRGVLTFEPSSPLANDRDYQVWLLPGITDFDGLLLQDTVKIWFHTTATSYAEGQIVDAFESDSTWLAPNKNPSSSGLDSAATRLLFTTEKRISNYHSAKLTYTFLYDSTGTCVFGRTRPILVSDGSAETFGMWVFGDNSNNVIRIILSDSGQIQKEILTDTLNWAGWKMTRRTLDTADSLYLSDIRIIKQIHGETSGTLYFDDAQINITFTGMDEKPNSLLPKTVTLRQNYPNPFNPATTIYYRLPAQSKVRLTVFNALGQKVRELVNSRQKPGQYRIRFDAGTLASGIYFYRLNVNGVTLTKKMLLLR